MKVQVRVLRIEEHPERGEVWIIVPDPNPLGTGEVALTYDKGKEPPVIVGQIIDMVGVKG